MSNIRSAFKKIISSLNPHWYNLKQCSSEGVWNFDKADQSIESQWIHIIWPLVKDFNFDSVLELAPGGGRNTEKLARLSKVIYAVDISKYSLMKLQNRFANYQGDCQLHFYQNNGSDLPMIGNETISTIYCWDSAVHFDKSVMHDYMREFYRVLKVDGRGFIHHSNLGSIADNDIKKNPHWPSNLDKDLFRKYCQQNKMKIVRQVNLLWGDSRDSSGQIEDFISIFQKV